MAKPGRRRNFKPSGLTLMIILSVLMISVFLVSIVSKNSILYRNLWGSRPNIIFILSDDLGYADLGIYGQSRIRTPNLDRMAAEGIRFTDFYAGSSTCAPSRCSLMTGLHQGHAFIRANAPVVALRQQDVTVAEIVKQAGYKTAVIGKWALGDAGTTGSPVRKGFDYSFGFLNQQDAHNHYPEFLWRNEQRVEITPGTYAHDLFTQEALDFINRERETSFFLYLAYTIPHGPHEVPDDGPYRNETWPQEQKNYAAMITRMDADIGRILDLLKQTGIDDNTIVFFTSDNGPPDPEFFRSTGPLKGIKGDLDEGSIRVPMIARWPGHILAGQVTRQLRAFWDFLPTAVELTGASFTGESDGKSLLPVLLGNQQDNKPLYWEKHIRSKRGGSLLQAARMDNWKILRNGRGQPIHLYDLEADQEETVNLAAQRPDIVKRMKKIMRKSHTESPIWPSK